MATNPFRPPLSFMDTPAWMQVVEPRLEQAAEKSSDVFKPSLSVKGG